MMTKWYGENPGEELTTKSGAAVVFEGFLVGNGKCYSLSEGDVGYSFNPGGVVYDDLVLEGILHYLNKDNTFSCTVFVEEDELEKILTEESFEKLMGATKLWV